MNLQTCLFPLEINTHASGHAPDRTGRNRHAMEGLTGTVTAIIPTEIGDLATLVVDGTQRIIRVLARSLDYPVS